MAERGKFSRQNIGKDVNKQDRDAERSESPITESERYLREMGKPSASMSMAAKDVKKASEGSSADRDVVLKKGGIEAGAARCCGGESGASELSKSASEFSESLLSAVPIESGLSAARCRRSAKAAEVARVAAHNARNAAQTALVILKQILDSATVGRNKMEQAYYRNSVAKDINDSNHYRNMADMYTNAIESISLKCYDVEVAAGHAVRSAEAAVQALSEVGDETTPNESRICSASSDIYIANANTVTSFHTELLGLELAKKLWRQIDRAENSGTRTVNRRRRLFVYGENHDVREESKCAKCVPVLSFVLGSGILASLGFFELPTVPFYSVISVGSVMIGWAVKQAIHRLCVCCKDRRLLASVSETRIIIRRIEARLLEMPQYFENNRFIHISMNLEE